MDIIETEALVNLLTAERAAMKGRIADLQFLRSHLARFETGKAREYLDEITAIQKLLKVNRIELIKASEVFQRREQHGLWESAVFTLWGQDGLTACRAQMRSIKDMRDRKP